MFENSCFSGLVLIYLSMVEKVRIGVRVRGG